MPTPENLGHLPGYLWRLRMEILRTSMSKTSPTASLVGNDPTEHIPEQVIGSKRVKKMLENTAKILPKTLDTVVAKRDSPKRRCRIGN